MEGLAQSLEGFDPPPCAISKPFDRASNQHLDHGQATHRAVERGWNLDRTGNHMLRERCNRRVPDVRHQHDSGALRGGAGGEFEYVALIAAEVKDHKDVAVLDVEQVVGPAGTAIAHQMGT